MELIVKIINWDIEYTNAYGILSALFFAVLSEYIRCDYGYFGVLIIFFFYLFREHKVLMNLSFVIMVFVYYGKNLLFGNMFNVYLLIVLCTIFPLLFINLYNHKKGRDTKYFLYFFYPLHLLLIWVVGNILYL